eukprot:scaffold126530_cov18-Tisochrysis_lutea.AAC.3
MSGCARRLPLQDPSSSAMLPDMHAALQQAHEAAACCSAAATAGDVKAMEQSASMAERAGGVAQRIAAAVAPHWVGVHPSCVCCPCSMGTGAQVACPVCSVHALLIRVSVQGSTRKERDGSLVACGLWQLVPAQ